jgi:hypothetical protein
MLYAAYGSNLLPARLLARVPEAALVGTCRIPGRRLAFHLASLDGSGKCDIPPAPGDGHCVRAALYRLDESGWARLDAIEGVGISYVRLGLRIQDSPEAGMAEAYVAVEGRTDGGLRPYGWYKRLVLEGARYHGFPTDYLESIAGVPSTPDPDRSRARRNLGLLESLEEQG